MLLCEVGDGSVFVRARDMDAASAACSQSDLKHHFRPGGAARTSRAWPVRRIGDARWAYADKLSTSLHPIRLTGIDRTGNLYQDRMRRESDGSVARARAPLGALVVGAFSTSC